MKLELGLGGRESYGCAGERRELGKGAGRGVAVKIDMGLSQEQ